MNAPKRTPGPWIDSPHANTAGRTIWSEDVIVATVPDDQHGNSAANADFIVRACNAHDALVAALRSAEKTIAAHIAVGGQWNAKLYDEAVAINAALAAAGERP